MLGETEKEFLNELFKYARQKLAKCYLKLECNYNIPEGFCTKVQQIENLEDTETYLSFLSNTDDNFEDSEDIHKNTIIFTEKLETANNSLSSSQTSISSISDSNEMAHISKVEFIKLCASTINQHFDGDPLKLGSFLNSIDLLQSMATNEELKDSLVKFIKTKLVGKALEYMPEDPLTIEQIVALLRDKVKPESSKIIEGRLAALRTDKQSLQNFSKIAEELAENLKRSLIMEGMTPQKANEVTIDKTVKMCRASARSDLTKSVIASTKFNEPKEVISTFVVEIGQEVEERQVLAYRAQGRKSYHNNQNQNRNQNRNRKYYNNRNGNNNNNNQGYYRGRKRNNNNYNNNNNNRPVNDNDRNRSHNNVRYTSASGNERRPAPEQQELVHREEL